MKSKFQRGWFITEEESISGLVERVTYHNPENGYCVLQVKVRGHRDLISVVGHASLISAGEFIHAAGKWINDKNYGLQYKAEFLKATPPTTEEGIEKYLGSGMIKGIGPVYAKKLLQHFGVDVFDIIEYSPERLTEVAGIGKGRASKVTKGWADQKAIREIMLFLHQYGISTSRAVRIYKTLGSKAIQIITDNPYILAQEIRGIGFISADKIAQNMGIELDSPLRLQSGIHHCLLEAMDEGHCGYPITELIQLGHKLLEVSHELIEKALHEEIQSDRLIAHSVEDTECVFLKGLYLAEQKVAERLCEISQQSLPWPEINASKAIPWVENKLNITLSETQKDALKQALKAKTLVITGGPGVGKTTLVNSLMTILKAKQLNIALCAPTGRAAKRLSESTGLEAKTLHRLLEVNPQEGGFKRNQDNPLECDLLVLDESSMVDILLMNSLLKATPDHAAIILIGDVDQLPSVGPGKVLSDIIDSQSISVVRLTEIFRQAAESYIIKNAHRVNQGLFPQKDPRSPSDFYFIEAKDPENCRDIILRLVSQKIPQSYGLNPLTDIQVLCPMNRGGVGARSLNIDLQTTLNPHHPGQIEKYGNTFGIGDRVMQISNNYDKDVYNGDIGFIQSMNEQDKELVIRFDQREVPYDFDEMDEVVLAYASSIHKSQGSEYPAVVIPIMTQHYPMLQKKLIYTGMTRGKTLVILVGQKKALYLALKAKTSDHRWTLLKEWLITSLPASRRVSYESYRGT